MQTHDWTSSHSFLCCVVTLWDLCFSILQVVSPSRCSMCVGGIQSPSLQWSSPASASCLHSLLLLSSSSNYSIQLYLHIKTIWVRTDPTWVNSKNIHQHNDELTLLSTLSNLSRGCFDPVKCWC